MRFEVKLFENLVFGRSRSNSRVFEKNFISYSCILFIKHYALRSFYIKMLCFSNIWFFQISIDQTCCSTDRKCIKILGLNLLGSIGIRSMLDRLKLKNFQFLSFWPNFFHASFVFRIHMHCIVFLYLSCSFTVISLITFTHNMHKLC